ncbi:uncharacterized protein [Parasteatoda tepidariorum]|uniref:uncharacterized protein n=1 Tax=Parasteatoda tepidariorum TaxID=114398 RepID=UPI001C727071|nr:uncharacterized protein LOC107450395 [Parasteatoda tepidariorum]XP_042895968.1 uncharacterized protein LOC107450395 [Parasteatoda tepidariorum]
MTSSKRLQALWLLKPAWYDFPMSKGLGHHRIPVGIILAANNKMEIALESRSLTQVRVRLLNDGRKTEGNFTVKSSLPGRASTFKLDSVSVPFVDCEYLEKPPTDNRDIRISYPAGSKTLPIYHFDDKEEDFFALWDSQDAEFAYVESDYFGLLIPKIDKEATRKLANGKRLNDLIIFYDNIFTTYSQFIGLSFEETGTDQNVRNRFFIKADKNGFGLAYYDLPYTAMNSGSVTDFWLDVSPGNWGALHEIGHGHELRNLGDETLTVNEVWNNILCFFYQTIKFGKDIRTKGTKQREMNIAAILKIGIEVKSWDVIQKLSFLTHMFLKAGQKSFSRFNQLTREEFDGRPYYASGTLLLEKLMHFFAIEFAVDVYPFMKLAKAAIQEGQLYEHYYVLSSVAYPLNYIISDVKEMLDVYNNLGLHHLTSLVTPTDLKSTQMKNDFTVDIDNQILGEITGDMLKLMDGSRTVAQQKIQSQIITFQDVPIGVYKVFIEPNAKNMKLAFDDFYAIVHANYSNKLFLTGKVMKDPSLSLDKIKFLGLADNYFANLTANPFKEILTFRFFSSNPHSYFENKKYVSLNVKNQRNEVLFSKSLDGNSSNTGVFDIPMKGELQVEIFHEETKIRLKTDDPMMDVIIDRTAKTNYFTVNELGFQNKNKNAPKDLLEKNFLRKIEFKANKIRNKISLFVKPHCQPKYNLLLAVEAFERLFRNNSVDKSLRDKYKDCLPSP